MSNTCDQIYIGSLFYITGNIVQMWVIAVGFVDNSGLAKVANSLIGNMKVNAFIITIQ
jgi:hypothetical protein